LEGIWLRNWTFYKGGDQDLREFSLDQNLVLNEMEISKSRQTIPVKNLNVKNFVSPDKIFGKDFMG
jgi:hypothetical protein